MAARPAALGGGDAGGLSGRGRLELASRLPANATTDGAPPPSPREGFSAPDFTLDTLEGGQVTLSELRGKVVMVNFWATWCPPCRVEMSAIEKVYRAYRDLGLEVLAVNTTNQDSEAEAAAFVREFGLTFPIPLNRTGAVSASYNLRGLSSNYLIDTDGVIESVVVGGLMSEPKRLPIARKCPSAVRRRRIILSKLSTIAHDLQVAF